MKIVTKEQIRAIDHNAIHEYGVPSVLLMEHAAYSVYKELNKLPKGHIVIVCGLGNNGGDGLALARQLKLWSEHQVSIMMMGPKDKLSQDAKIYFEICRSMGMALVEYNSKTDYDDLFDSADYLVDALLGTGLSKPVRGDFYHIIEAMNQVKKPVISIDIPSGICADTGRILGIAIKATQTITFALPKIGLCIYPGVSYCGQMICADIGIPPQIIETMETEVEMTTVADVSKWIPKRSMRSNKGTYGKVLVIGGQKGMSGAVTLAAHSTLKIGAGIVSVAVPRTIHDILEQKLTETMTIPLADVGGHIGIDAITEIQAIIENYSHVVIGPGIGRSKEVTQVLKAVLDSQKPCVIDADGLYALKPILEEIKERQAPIVITPHPGELSHLIEVPVEAILDAPLECTKQFANDYGITVVCKIERTIISDGKKSWINTTGNSGLAKGGSGDVLAGMVGGMMAQGLDALRAAVFAVYCHGMAADLLCERGSMQTLMASDLIGKLDEVLYVLEQ
ncbi:MAG: NAD(P)H-hydrate dehydratase [Cellulosilyticaceae bacterium]